MSAGNSAGYDIAGGHRPPLQFKTQNCKNLQARPEAVNALASCLRAGAGPALIASEGVQNGRRSIGNGRFTPAQDDGVVRKSWWSDCRCSNSGGSSLQDLKLVTSPIGPLITKIRIKRRQVRTRIQAIGTAGLLPKRHKLAGVFVPNTSSGAHHSKRDCPDGHVCQVTSAACE